MSGSASKRVWIDLENTPHVPFFLPIIHDLKLAGCDVVLTARDFAQTKALVERTGLDAKIIGEERGRQRANRIAQSFRDLQFGIRYGFGDVPDVTESPGRYFNPLRIVLSRLTFGYVIANLLTRWSDHSRIRKIASVYARSKKLEAYLRGKDLALAVGHGSRGLLLASRRLRIPSLTLYDYEGASVQLFNRMSTWVMTPDVIPYSTLEGLGLRREKHLTYPGLKENVYVEDFQPQPTIGWDVDANKIIVVLRPPSETAHYRSDASSTLFHDILKLLWQRQDVYPICVPRTPEQRERLSLYQDKGNVLLLDRAVDGLNLLYHSDLVIGGGGTMNREAAALGVPVVSIFKGPEGAVDHALIQSGRMIAIEHAEEILPLLQKRTDRALPAENTATRRAIVDTILRLLNERDGRL